MHIISKFEAGPSAHSDAPVGASSRVPLLVHVATVSSTNDLLRDLVRDPRLETPHLTTVLADHQSAGRGRLGRTWESPAGRSLSASTLLDLPPTAAPADSLPWFALAAALAARDAIARRLEPPGHEVRVKWPNDVVVDGSRKIAGLLAELLDATTQDLRLAIGLGLNVALEAGELPTPVATSLSLEGDLDAGDDPAGVIDSVLTSWLEGLDARVRSLVEAGGNAVTAGLHAELTEHCVTLGRRVTIRRPDDPGSPTPRPGPTSASPPSTATAAETDTATPTTTATAIAIAIATDGSLQVRTPDGATHSVTAGDVEIITPT